MTTHVSSQPNRLSASSPSFFASILGMLMGVAMMVAGAYWMGGAETSATLNIAIMVVGLMEAAACFYALHLHRVAWAFALSINGTACIVMLFSAPRIRDASEIGLGVALAPSVLFGAIVVLYTIAENEF